ncbi:hypothetical protein DFH06DRAFT_1445914 [Mycena polygramma]|nr:hypothetical protein DFH06DRAFT_1445914 [Mycena polygramma]
MHPALRLENLNRLLPSMRRAARSACSATRSIDDIRPIQTYIATATEAQTLLMLPVFYTNLDPSDVPDQDRYDTENPPADAESRIGRALMSLISLYTLPSFLSKSALISGHVSGPGYKFLMFAGTFANHEETFSLIRSTPGVWFFVAKAWPCVPKLVDPKKREVGFSDLRSFITGDNVLEPANLAELIDGAGGTLGHLAHLTALYLEAMIPVEGSTIHYMYVLYVCAILDFAGHMEPAFRTRPATFGAPLGAFGAALTTRNIVQTLTRILCILEKADSDMPLFSMTEHAVKKSFWILGTILVATPGKIQWLSDALEVKLLPAFKKSRIYDRWTQFSDLAEERISVLDAYDDRETRSMKACDNLACGEIRLKSAFQKCSGCLSLYYCSEPCQAMDWVKGGHRRACKTYGPLSLPSGDDLELTVRDRSFLRALVHHEYRKPQSKVDIFCQTVTGMATHPGEGTLVLYDFTQGSVKINLEPLNSDGTTKALGGPEWTDIVSRAERSGWRMRLDVLVFSGPNGTQYYVVPLRTNNSTVHDRLQALADPLPRDRETWDRDGTVFATSFGELAGR